MKDKTQQQATTAVRQLLEDAIESKEADDLRKFGAQLANIYVGAFQETANHQAAMAVVLAFITSITNGTKEERPL